MLKVRSPPIFAFNSSSKSRFSPICNFAGFLPPLPPLFDEDGIGGIFPNPVPPSTFCSAFLLFRRRRRLRLLLVPVVLVVSLLLTDSVSLSMRSPDMSRWSWLLALGFVVVIGMGPPGPPRRRGCEVVLAEEVVEGFALAREAVSGEDISVGSACRAVPSDYLRLRWQRC